jgi:hypothetical protein
MLVEDLGSGPETNQSCADNAPPVPSRTHFGYSHSLLSVVRTTGLFSPRATNESTGSRTRASLLRPSCSAWFDRMPRTAIYFIESALTGLIVRVSSSPNRVWFREAFEWLERMKGNVSSPVLRGPRATRLPVCSRASAGVGIRPTRFTALSATTMEWGGNVKNWMLRVEACLLHWPAKNY